MIGNESFESALSEFRENDLRDLIVQPHSVPVLIAGSLRRALLGFRQIFEAQARALGTGCGRDDYERLKERIHANYVELASPFMAADLAELAFRCYWHLLGTLSICARITGYHFDYGLAFHNSGVALARMQNIERGIALIELAHVEDARIQHTTGAARRVLERVMARAWMDCDTMVQRSRLELLSTEA